MQPQPPIGKKGSIINNQNKFSQARKFPKANGNGNGISQNQTTGQPRYTIANPPIIMQNTTIPNPPPPPPKPHPQNPQYQYNEPEDIGPEPEMERVQHQEYQDYSYTVSPESGQAYQDPQPQPQPQYPFGGPEEGEDYPTPQQQIDRALVSDEQKLAYQHIQNQVDDEREFIGGKKLYDRQLMQQPMYDEPTMQILNDIAADESFPILVQYITQLAHLGRQQQARLIARAAAAQSKNQVFSNIQNQNDYMMAQDDFTYAQIMSKCDFSSYDTNADYFTAEAIMEAQFNIRLRRSRNALNLLQINTQRQESIMSQHPAQEEERKLRSKIPFLGQHMG